MNKVDLPEQLKQQIEQAYMSCTVEIPTVDKFRATNFQTFTEIVNQVMKLAYIDGIIEGLNKAKEIANTPQINY